MFFFSKGQHAPASSGLHLKLNACRTSSFGDFYFNRITLMRNSLLQNIKDSDTIGSFKSKLKSFYFARLLNAFDGDNFRSFIYFNYLNCNLVGSGKGSLFGIFLSGIFFTGLGVGVLTK